MSLSGTLERLSDRRDLTIEEAEALMTVLAEGEASDAQIGGLLIALRMKGVTGQELAGFAKALRARSEGVDHHHPHLIDTCGTGGGCPSFNISTAAALVAAGAGAKVAKHGNRAVTSACGSADVLEALGAKLDLSSELLLELLDEVGIAFFFAPSHHPALRHVGRARKELGVRTVFNQLGPLLNPAGAKRQIIGVYQESLLEPMAEALSLLGAEWALVLRGTDELDEVSPRSSTQYVQVKDGQVDRGMFETNDFGLSPVPDTALLPGDSIQENAAILVEAVSDPESVRSQAVLPSASLAIYVAGLASSLEQAAERARHSIATGLARQTLSSYINSSNS
jgi:anthranilate phosphoribosyltransferase